MRPLEEHETLALPDEQVCPHCSLRASGQDDIDRAFGFRRMGDAAHTVRPVSWCKRCRVLAKKGELPPRATAQLERTFEEVRGDLPGVVYIISAHDRDEVKIGYSQSHPIARLKIARTWAPFPVELLGFWAGDYFAETTTHAELHERHLHGEWFAMSRDEALALILERDGTEHDSASNDNNEHEQGDLFGADEVAA